MCLFASITVPCSHQVCQQRLWGSVGESGLAALLAMQANVLGEVVRQGEVIAALLQRVGRVVGNQLPEADSQPQKQDKDYQFALVLDSLPKLPVMRESSFPLSGWVTTSDGQLSSHLSGTTLNLSLYTVDSPPRLLTFNIVGKSILRGSLQATVETDGRFCFPKVVINEVSSHYLEDEFTLLVSAEQACVKPGTCRHLNVKARKKLRRGKPDDPRFMVNSH